MLNLIVVPDVFGAIRAALEAHVINVFNSYPALAAIGIGMFKNTKGNISMSSNSLLVTSATCSGGVITVCADFT